MSNTGAVLQQSIEDLVRETFDGGLPGRGTYYLDHDSGILPTLRRISAADASAPRDGHATIAAHARHMNVHLRASIGWIRGVREPVDWPASFEPPTVTDAEWPQLIADLDASRHAFIALLREQPLEELARGAAGAGVIAHLAYHVGAIRAVMPRA